MTPNRLREQSAYPAYRKLTLIAAVLLAVGALGGGVFTVLEGLDQHQESLLVLGIIGTVLALVFIKVVYEISQMLADIGDATIATVGAVKDSTSLIAKELNRQWREQERSKRGLRDSKPRGPVLKSKSADERTQDLIGRVTEGSTEPMD